MVTSLQNFDHTRTKYRDYAQRAAITESMLAIYDDKENVILIMKLIFISIV